METRDSGHHFKFVLADRPTQASLALLNNLCPVGADPLVNKNGSIITQRNPESHNDNTAARAWRGEVEVAGNILSPEMSRGGCSSSTSVRVSDVFFRVSPFT